MSTLEAADVVVCIPSTGQWQAPCAHSVSIMLAEFMVWRIPGLRRKRVSLLTKNGSMLSQLRHDLVKESLQSKDATHVLFIDSDMIVPKDLIQRLLVHDKDFVGANCVTRCFPPEFIAHDLDGKRIDSRGKTGLQKVQHVGAAVMLCKTEALRRLKPPLFLQDWIPEVNAYCGEDVYFCQVAQAAGFDLWIDHDLSMQIQHIGTVPFGPDMICEAADAIKKILDERTVERRSRENNPDRIYLAV